MAKLFAVEVAGFAVMSNHLHVVVRMQRDLPHTWGADDVARRWFAVYPAAYFADGTPKPASDALVQSKWPTTRGSRNVASDWVISAGS
jgi:hypothetical protein